LKGGVGGEKSRSILREMTMFDENCGYRGTRGGCGDAAWRGAARRGASCGIVSRRIVTPRSGIQIALLAVSPSSFPPRQKGESPGVNAGQKPRRASRGRGQAAKTRGGHGCRALSRVAREILVAADTIIQMRRRSDRRTKARRNERRGVEEESQFSAGI